jgi:hypothetical protein
MIGARSPHLVDRILSGARREPQSVVRHRDRALAPGRRPGRAMLRLNGLTVRVAPTKKPSGAGIGCRSGHQHPVGGVQRQLDGSTSAVSTVEHHDV